MIKKKETIKQNTLFYFALFLMFAFLSVGIVTADTSVAWTKDIGDVTSVDMADDGSVLYAAVSLTSSASEIYVYDSSGIQQNIFEISGNAVKIVCTADGTRAAVYTDDNVVYYIDNGAITWTQSFSAITDIDISNIGSVLIVESTEFHKYRSDGSVEYNSSSGTFSLGVIDSEDEFAIVKSGTVDLNKYILSTNDQYWGLINSNTFNTAFQGYQNLLILYTNETNAIILSNETLGEELWDEIYTNLSENQRYYAKSDESLTQTGAYTYLLDNWHLVNTITDMSARQDACVWVYNNLMWMGGGRSSGSNNKDVWYSSDGISWTQATASAGWAARYGACAWVYNNKMWIGGGQSSYNVYYNDVWYSSDGISWTQATASAGWAVREGACAWVYNNRMWIGGGYTTGVAYNDVWYSTNGASWTQATASAGWAARYGACAWVYNNRMWIGGGRGYPSNTNYNDVWYSTNGASWTQATASAGWTARRYACAWVYNNQMWIGGGIGSTQSNDVWYSTNGASWTQATASAGWTARNSASAWVYNNQMWIGGGVSTSLSIWHTADPYIAISSSANPKYVFYKFTGTNPSHTQASYSSFVDFSGTTELRTKPTLSIYSLQTSKTYSENIDSISLSDRGDWLGVLTDLHIYHDQITNAGFGTEYTAVLGGDGTPYSIATANSAAMSIIGQGQTADIYTLAGSRVGTYTAGGLIQYVDIADKNALWATSGGEDGKVYVFSKDESSNWYLEYSSDSENPITALRMSARGEYVLAGRTNSLTLYQTNTPVQTSTDFWFTLYAYKDSDSYRNAAVNVSVYSGNQWNPFAQGLTDSVGKYVVQLTAGDSYKFDVGGGEKMLIYQATPTVTSQTISIYSTPISSALKYDAVWDNEIGGISFDYVDSSGQTQSVTIRILRTDNWDVVYEETFTGQQSIQENLPIIDDTTGYKVEMSATRTGSGVTRNTFFVSSSRDIVPIPLDQNIKNVLFSGLLMVLAGLFSYLSAIRGAIVVSFAAVFFVYLGWLTIPWHWLIVAIVISLVAGFTQRRS